LGSCPSEPARLRKIHYATKDGRIELENYGQEPVRLTTITQEK
jgi:hypothetical protein